MPHSKGYVDAEYLKAAAAINERIKRASYEMMNIQLGSRVLDVGCGPGTDTIPMAEIVGEQGQVVGVDFDHEMIVKADQVAAEAGVEQRVTHIEGDAGRLPFPADGFDSCRSERLLQHLENPAQAVSEMIRVTRPGGWIVVLDTDWSSASIDSPHVDIERRLVRFHTESFNNGYSGRKLFRLCRQGGMIDVTADAFAQPIMSYALARLMGQFDTAEQEALAAGVVSNEELDEWHVALELAEQEGVFFATATMIVVTGRKPLD